MDEDDTPTIRRAREADLPAIVRLLADDELGRQREDPREPLDPAYGAAFARIAADPGERLLVAEQAGRIVATLQISLIDGLAHRGRRRAIIEAVRVAADLRGAGIGARMIEHAVELARAAGARSVELTSDLRRPEAHRFYERLGFAASHRGFKLPLA